MPGSPPATLRAGYQGEPGAFSEEAARRALGNTATPVPLPTFEGLFSAVNGGAIDVAVVPIENTLAGSVIRNFDLLEEYTNLTIFDEVVIRIVHNLIGIPGAELRGLRRVFSHPVALAQCETFLRARPTLEVLQAYDTAGSVKMIMEAGRPEDAAIASTAAAQHFGGEILAAGIESNPRNFTRFFLVAPRDKVPSVRAHTESVPERATGRPHKTTILFRVPHVAGALHRSLGIFAAAGVDLTKVESRPIPGRPWEYSFHLDFIGNEADPAIATALAALREQSELVRVLGSYPRAIVPSDVFS